jgi:hypothetical protein
LSASFKCPEKERLAQWVALGEEKLVKVYWLDGIRSSNAQLRVQICVPRAVRKRREATGRTARLIVTMESAMLGRMMSNWLSIVLSNRQISAL